MRRDAVFHTFVKKIVSTVLFNILILCSIFLNAITIAMETTMLREMIPFFFIIADNVFSAVYTFEFILKVYAEPVGYWKNYYHVFDVAILMFSVSHLIVTAVNNPQEGYIAIKVIRVLRSLCIIRLISFSRGLQVLVTAFVYTLVSALFHLILLLLIFMFIFTIMGYYLFGYEVDGDKKNWGDFGIAMLSLFNYVTADGWTELQKELTNRGYTGSEFFTITFLFLGHFLFTNLFIGAVIINIHSATKNDTAAKRAKKEAFIRNKKEVIIKRYHKDVLEVEAKQKESNFANFQELTKELQKTLRHDDFIYTTDLSTTIPWMETMVTSLTHLESSKFRVQQSQYEIFEVLASAKEQQTEHQQKQ